MDAHGETFMDEATPLAGLLDELAQRLREVLEEYHPPEVEIRPRSAQIIDRDSLRQVEPSCRFGLLCRRVDSATAACLEVTPPLADAMIDLLLGSPPRPLGQARQGLTTIDRRLVSSIIERLVPKLNNEMRKISLQLELPASQEDVPGASTSAAEPPLLGEKLLELPLDVTVGPCKGQLRLCLPAAAMAEPPKPHRPKLKLTAVIEDHIDDPTAMQTLAAGDVFVTEASPDGEVTICVDGVPRFAGKLGQFAGHRAVTITRKLD